MDLKIGDKFFGSHGDAEEGEVHDHYAYIVSGIASPTGKVIDNLILCNIPSVWAMHDHGHEEGAGVEEEHAHDHENGAAEETHDHEHDGEEHQEMAQEEAVEHNREDGHDHDHAEGEAHDHEHDHDHDDAHAHEEEIISEEGKEITAVLIEFKGPVGIAVWPRLIAMNTKMQAASPAIEINRLFSLFGIGLQALQYMAYGIMLISGISIFIALYNTLKERKYEFALLRVNGASRFQLLALVLIESLLLCLVGFLFGTIVGRVALSLISGSSEDEYKMSFNPFEFVWEKEGFLFLLTIFVGILAAVIPAVKAYSLNISKTLANA
jgi:putative ABC transport system permease protein